jgi:hypothetical protein
MGNQHYNYYDPEFDPNHIDDHHELLIMISGDIFSFAVIQKATKKVLIWGEQYKVEELGEPVELTGLTFSQFKNVKIGVQSPSFTIVHKDLYQADKVTSYAKYLDVKSGETVLVNELDSDNYVLFTLAETLSKTLKDNFALQPVFFAGKAWIAAINKATPYLQPLFINVDGNVAQLYHSTNHKLDFYNSFQFNNADELMYYIVLTANELNINLDATSVVLSGDISVSDKKIQRVSDLLPKVDFNHNEVVLLPSGFIHHQILMLAGLTLCESSAAN